MCPLLFAFLIPACKPLTADSSFRECPGMELAPVLRVHVTDVTGAEITAFGGSLTTSEGVAFTIACPGGESEAECDGGAFVLNVVDSAPSLALASEDAALAYAGVLAPTYVDTECFDDCGCYGYEAELTVTLQAADR